MPRSVRLISTCPDRTILAGHAAGSAASPGDFIALVGALGGGKTVFVKGLARGLGVPDWDLVSSPTFTLTSRYRGRLKLLHMDAFRLSGPADLEDLGFEECVAQEGVTAVEWADRGTELLPAERLEVAFEHLDENSRALVVTGFGAPGERLLRAVASAFSPE